MNILVLIPGIISFVLVLRGRLATAFLSVYLPTLLLLPQEYSLRLPHLPPFSAAEYALIPIGMVALNQLVRSRSFRLMDFLVALFCLSFAISEILHDPVLNDGIFSAISSFVTVFLAYVTGRRLIEPDLRFETVRRIVIFFLVAAPLGLWEWRMGQNLYGWFGEKFLGIPLSEGIYMRNGHGRLGGSFNSPEIVGIAYGMTFALNSWLVFLNKGPMNAKLGKIFSKMEKFHLPGLFLILLVGLTLSRGPQIALAAGFIILQITRVKYTKLATVMVVLLLVLGALGAKQYFSKVTSVTDPSQANEELTSSAMYRREMNEIYPKIAEKGGLFGYGVMQVPHVEGMNSIDNHFLLVWLSQGKFGFYLLILICVESLRTATARLWAAQTQEDRVFACSLLAAFATLWITLYTVYMGEQLPQFAFMLMGWGQSLVLGATTAAPGAGAVAGAEGRPKFFFRRIFS